MLTDAEGTPLAATLTGANRHDVTQLLPLVDAVPAVRGRPVRRPLRVQGDRAYDSRHHRRELRRRGIAPALAGRGVPHDSGLGRTRWPVERTLSRLHQFKRLRTRYEIRDDTHEGFMELGEVLICHRIRESSL